LTYIHSRRWKKQQELRADNFYSTIEAQRAEREKRAKIPGTVRRKFGGSRNQGSNSLNEQLRVEEMRNNTMSRQLKIDCLSAWRALASYNRVQRWLHHQAGVMHSRELQQHYGALSRLSNLTACSDISTICARKRFSPVFSSEGAYLSRSLTDSSVPVFSNTVGPMELKSRGTRSSGLSQSSVSACTLAEMEQALSKNYVLTPTVKRVEEGSSKPTINELKRSTPGSFVLTPPLIRRFQAPLKDAWGMSYVGNQSGSP
jgi:hypothetical protein